MFLFTICPAIRKGSDRNNCIKLWTLFCKFYVLSIQFIRAAPFFLLKLLQSWFHPSASSVFDPAKFKARVCFATAFHCCLLIPHSVFCSVSHRQSFHPHYRHDQNHCVHLKVLQVSRFLLPLFILK